MVFLSLVERVFPPSPRNHLWIASAGTWLVAVAAVVTMIVVHEESGPWMRMGVPDPICDRLTKWIIDHGGAISGVQCVNRPEAGGRGVLASRRLRNGEAYLSLPKHLWFYIESIQANSTIRDLLETDPTIAEVCGDEWDDDPCRMMVALEYETYNPDSFWRAYIDTFPSRPTSLTWWSDQQLADLQSPVLVAETRSSQHWINESYHTLFPKLCQSHPALFKCDGTRHSYASWAASVIHVWARAFQCTSEAFHNGTAGRVLRSKPLKVSGMMPFADLINHQSYTDGLYSDEYAAGEFVVKATEAYEPSAEIYHSYGSHHSSHHYLTTYGFVPNGWLQADYIAVLMPTGTDGAPVSTRVAGNKKGRLVGFIGIDGHIYPEEFLKVYAFTLLRTSDPKLTPNQYRRNPTIKIALGEIIHQLERNLNEFPTTYEADLAELAEGFKSYEQWVSITVRCRFKAVFKAAIETLSMRLKDSTQKYTVSEEEWQQNYGEGFDTAHPASTTTKMSLFTVDLQTHPSSP